MIFLDDGTAIIDTPGMREFALADADEGLNQTFVDVAEQAKLCRFRDCKHEAEPGCEVRDQVDPERLSSWRKLEREAAFEARKTDRLLAAAEKQRWKSIHKEAKKRMR
jgi:ribosome biogenesis GTPase